MLCYLATIPVDFCFICLSLFCNIVLTPLFSHIFLPPQLLIPPLVHRHTFLTLLFLLFCLLILPDVDSMHFVTFH